MSVEQPPVGRSVVLFVGHSAGRTGAPIVLCHLLRWLKENSAIDFALLLREGGPLRRQYEAICPTYVCQAGWIGKLGKFGSALRRAGIAGVRPPGALRRRSCGLVYANTMTVGLVLEALGKPAVPVVTHVHEMGYWIDRSGTRNLDSIRARTRRYIAVSNAVRETLTNRYGIPSGAIDVVHEFVPIPPPVAPDRRALLRREFGIPEDAFVVLGSGFETWRKGKDLFIELALRCRELLPARDLRFVWTGGWEGRKEESDIVRRIEAAGVGKEVRFVGEVDRPLDYALVADAFALVSREDPFPLVALEAAAMALPVLCFSGAGGTPELVEEDAGFVVPFEATEAMAIRLAELVMNPVLARRLGARGADKVRARHSVEVAAPQILAIVNRQLAHGSGSGENLGR